jgi:tetratricopeptide (TPR) repeat protein
MELRPPPSSPQAPTRDRAVRGLLVFNLIVLLAIGAFLYMGSGASRESHPERADHARDIASQLKAAGALDEAATLYQIYLESTDAPEKTRANVAYSLGSTYLEGGRYEKALRWFYEAEALGVGELSDQLSKKIVHTLERLGRFHSAKAALDSRVQLDPGAAVQRAASDPVVAKIDGQEIYKSEVLRTLDDLPPEVVEQFQSQRGELLKKHVADELMWRKAVKLEYDKDPEVRRRYEALLKQLAISKFLESEVVAQIEVDPTDLANFFEANRKRYEKEGEELKEMPPEAERDYRMSKIQAEYGKLIEQELATDDVELFPERMADAQ